MSSSKVSGQTPQRHLTLFPLAPCSLVTMSWQIFLCTSLSSPPPPLFRQRALLGMAQAHSSLTFSLERVHHWAAVPQLLPHTPQPILCGLVTFLRHRCDRTTHCLESCQWVFITDRVQFTFLSMEHKALPTDLPASSLSIFSHSRDCSLRNSPRKPAHDAHLAFRGTSSLKTPWCLRGCGVALPVSPPTSCFRPIPLF